MENFQKIIQAAKKVAKQVVVAGAITAASAPAVAQSSGGGTNNAPEINKTIYIGDPNDIRIKKYKDSLDIYDLSKKVARNPNNYPPSTKEKNDSLWKSAKNKPEYYFDDDQYKKDDRAGTVKDFKDYVYKIPSHNELIAKSGKRKDYDLDTISEAYARNHPKSDRTPDIKITQKDGSVRSYPTYKGQIVDYGLYTERDSKTGTERAYYAGKLGGIWSPNNKPIKIEYFAKDKIEELGSIDLSSSSTGWYEAGKKPKFKNTSNEHFPNYYAPINQYSIYKKPVQPYAYKAGAPIPEIVEETPPAPPAPEQKAEIEKANETFLHMGEHIVNTQFPNVKIVITPSGDKFFQNKIGERIPYTPSGGNIDSVFQYAKPKEK